MTKEEFIYLQDHVLDVKGKELAALIGAEPSSISGYRTGVRVIPDYIAKAVQTHAAIKIGKIKLPLEIGELLALSQRAESLNLTPEGYILSLLRGQIPAAPAARLYEDPAIARGSAASRLNEADPPAKGKRPA